MAKADRISGIPWLLFSIFVIIESYRMDLGTLHQPGPGFLYFWSGITLGVMSLVVLVRSWTSKKGGEIEIALFGSENLLKVLFVLGALFFYALFVEVLGFVLVTLLLFVFLLGVIEKKGWFFTVLMSVAVTAIAYLVFEIWLRSQLPKGLLEFVRF